MPTGTNKGKTPAKKAATADNKRAAEQAKNSADGIQRGSVPQEQTAKPKAEPKVQQTQRGDETPEAKRTTKEQQRAAEKLFANADDAAHRGYPPDITREQHENIVRRSALGY
jgi:hypothetical protein